MANLAWGANRTSGTMLSWLFSGLFQRFPNLKIALSEGEIGWIPYFLERAEQVLDKQRHWVQAGRAVHGPRRPPTSTSTPSTSASSFRDHIFGCFIDDAPRHREPRRDRRGQHHVRDRLPALRLDVARLHRRRRKRLIEHLPEEVQYKILRGNAERLYRFTPAEPPVLGPCLTPAHAWTIVVDRELCMGSGMCIVYAPGTFAHDDETKAVVDRPAG